jgi:hypothetical protein
MPDNANRAMPGGPRRTTLVSLLVNAATITVAVVLLVAVMRQARQSSL